MEVYRLVVSGLMGAVIGSFLNVVIWRLPRGESLIRPGSRCPRCGTGIRWFDNLPVLSWVLLRARCRACRAPISARYPLVEALTALLFVLAALRFGEPGVPFDRTALIVSAFLAALVAISFIDWDLRIIPDKITLPGVVLAILLAPLLPALHPPGWPAGASAGLAALLHALLGALTGAAAILFVRVLGRLAFRKEAMGLGDLKLLALVGALVGPVQTLYALVLACLLGAVTGSAYFLATRGRPLRFALRARAGRERREWDHARFEGGWTPSTRRIRRTGVRERRFLVVPAAGPEGAGAVLDLEMTLPAALVLEDEDAVVRAPAVIEAVEAGPRGPAWRLRVRRLGRLDKERLALFSASRRYIPFGPFLSVGGAAVLLYGSTVHWLITVWYPTRLTGWT